MPKHVVKQGDHISSIAFSRGYQSWKPVWEDPGNAALRQKRPNPNTLFPGDEVVVPEREQHTEDAATEQRHRFRLAFSPLLLRLRLLSAGGKALSTASVRLAMAGAEPLETRPDAKGMVETPIHPLTHAGYLTVEDDALPEVLQASLHVGSLDPADTPTGQVARLNNLGYNAGPVEEPVTPAAQERFRSAVEEFQCDAGIKPIDGKCEGATLTKLQEVYGC